MKELKRIIDATSLVSDAVAMEPYLTDWRGRYRGSAQAVVKPRNVDDVAAIMRWAASTGTPVVPQGGNTGLSGGATPDSSGKAIILSLERMNRIRSIDPVGNTLVAEAGCILANVQNAAREAGRLFPVSLGSEGSCQIGGIVATNAGGINVIRYGMTRDIVLGLEYVTADGTIVPGPKRLRKDNAGYDLRHILVGSEGTLAVITAASLKIVSPPRARSSAMCGVATPSDALALLEILREATSDDIISFELMCDGEMALVRDMLPAISLPLADRHAWYVFTEIGGDDDASVSGRLSDALATAVEAGVIADGVVSQSEAQAKAIWHLRFAVSEANRLAGPSVSHDVSVATADVPALLAALPDRIHLNFQAQTLFVGHVGDGNMHVIVLFSRDAFLTSGVYEDTAQKVNAIVYDVVTSFGGSISAEHGIGRSGRSAYSNSADPYELKVMRGIKNVFDPSGILNPGVLFLPNPHCPTNRSSGDPS